MCIWKLVQVFVPWICAFLSFLTLDTRGTPKGHQRYTRGTLSICFSVVFCGMSHFFHSAFVAFPCVYLMPYQSGWEHEQLHTFHHNKFKTLLQMCKMSWFAKSSYFGGKGGLLSTLRLQAWPSAVLQCQRRVQEKIPIPIQAGWEVTRDAVQSLCLSGH